MINSASARNMNAPDKQIRDKINLPDDNDRQCMTFTRTVQVNDNIMPSGDVLSNKPENFISSDHYTPDPKIPKLAVSNAHRKISLTAYEKPTPTTAESASVRHNTKTETSGLPIIDLPFIKSIEIPVKTALLQEYHPSSFLPPSQTIARPIHGLQHSCRTAIWALAILQQRKQQQDPRALNFPEYLVPLLVKACLFHDSGREGDGKDTTEWEKASSDNLQEHLRNCGMEQSLAWQCGEAIRHKDRPDACKHLPWEIQTLRSLLHDADTLEVMRVRSYFYIDKLECFAACHDDQSREAWRLLAREVCQVIAGQGDLWSTIDLQDNAKTVRNFFSQTATGCVNTKKQWEHHPSPLEYQLFTISTQSDFISKLITPFTGLPVAPEPAFSLARLNRQSESLGGSKIGQLYNDPVQQQCYYIKTAVSVESACNQALMANLARLLGVNAPVTFAHQEQGCSYVVSEVPADWPGNLKSGKAPLQSLPANQWARLLLVNTIVGNEAMVNEAWENIELTPQGEPVMLNWEFAGMATRYPCPDKPEPTSKEDDFSSMPVLLIKLRDPRAPAMNSHVIHNPCVAILSQLDDELLGQTLKTMLREVDWQALDQQIEHSGFLPGDRSWLRQTIHDRIAWLTTRFANSVEAGERVSMAEYQAIAAAGIRGGWLQVKGQDIRGGQICLTQRLDQDGKPITRMSLQLARNASNRLAYNLALEQGLHHLNTWINYLQCHHQSDSYRDWRSDLASLADECDQLAQQLIRDKERWNPSDHAAIDKAIKNLQANVATCRESLEADRLSIGENSLNLIQLPEPAFPARVCSRAAENIEAKVQLAEFSHGFARQTGQSASYFNKTQLNYAGLHASPVRVAELKPVSQEGHIEFIPEWLPEARALQNSLALTLPGHDKSVVEALFSELAGLGIHCQRPDASDLEERWLDALANYHGCLGDMNRAVAADTNADASVIARKKAFLEELLGETLRYEEQLRFRAGRLVYFRPGLPHDIAENPARSFCPGHNVSFLGNTDSKETVMASLANDGTLCSFERRMDIGLEPVTKDMKRQANVDARDVFARIQPVEHKIGHSLYGGQLSALFKSETLGRLDLCAIKDHCIYHDFHPGLETFRRNIKTILQSHGDYQEVMKAPYHEIFFTDSLSLFDELKTLHVSSSEDRLNLLHALKRRYSHWPDGRPLEALFQYSRSTRYYELISVYSRIPGNIKMLIKAFGEEGFELLLQQNPGLLEGKLQSLDGLKITTDTPRKLIGLDFRGCSMNDTEFERTKFKRCKFTMEHLNNASLESTFFKGCSFEGECFSLSVLKNAKFEPERIINDKKVTDNIPKLSQAISKSCINSQGQFNLELWLDVMEKNNYLLRRVVKKDLFWTHIIGRSPADETTKKILEEQIDNIIRMHPERLQFIVESFFRIKMNNVENISNFVKNNPKFYERKIVNVRDFYFDFKTSILREEGEENQEYKKRCVSNKWHFLTDVLWLIDPSKDVCSHAPREEVLALIVNIIEFVMFALEHEYIEFGINANDGGNQKSGKNFRITENNTMSCFELDHEYQNMMDKFKAEICYQHILEKCRNHFTKIWESCSDETRLEIAKCCLKNRIIAVSHLTTVEFMKLLIINQQGKHWLDDFTANMDKHKKNEYECNLSMKKWLWGIKDYDSTKIDESLKAFEQWIKAEAPDFTRRLSGNDLPYYGSENSLLFSE